MKHNLFAEASAACRESGKALRHKVCLPWLVCAGLGLLVTQCGEDQESSPDIVGGALGVLVNNRPTNNIRGAFLHMAADAIVSLGVVISGALILVYGMNWIDPVISLVIAAVIFLSTWGLLRDSLNLAVDAVPRNVDPEAVREYLISQPGVRALHDLHIWPMSTTDTALTAHLVMDVFPDSDQFLNDVSQVLETRFSIKHPTIQMERYDSDVICNQSMHCAD